MGVRCQKINFQHWSEIVLGWSNWPKNAPKGLKSGLLAIVIPWPGHGRHRGNRPGIKMLFQAYLLRFWEFSGASKGVSVLGAVLVFFSKPVGGSDIGISRNGLLTIPGTTGVIWPVRGQKIDFSTLVWNCSGMVRMAEKRPKSA